MKSYKLITLLLLSAFLLGNVTYAREAESGSGSGSRSNDDSGTHSGLEVEVEHGQTFLKPHGGAGSNSASRSNSSEGLEVETEHGVTFLKPHGSRDTRLENRLQGRILLAVQSKGEAWYVDPNTKQRVFLGRPADAFKVMREHGLGINNADLAQIARNDENRNSGSAARKLAGKIVLQVEENGEAWYINPVTLKRYFLGRPADAFNVMRTLGLGVTNDDLNKLEVK